uniref:DUF1653 domain-containing protein n=1 Tax=Agathobacter sp. TaxID=2021311 RepID=UPI004057BB11
MNRRPNSGEIYRHFKDKMYQVITVACHSETKEELVIYQALYGDYRCYARPLEMFVSEVDHQKYPNVKQKYRFEKVEMAAKDPSEEECQQMDNGIRKNKDVNVDKNSEKDENIKVVKESKNAVNHREAAANSGVRNVGNAINSSNPIRRNDTINREDETKYMTAEEKMMAFFDTDDLEKRYKILCGLRDEITDTMIDNMAVVMDVIIEDGNLTKRYDDLKHAIHTKQRYEQNTRLR